MHRDLQTLLDDLLEIESGLTGWEVSFIENLDADWRDRELTEKQHATLNEIARKCGLIE